MLEIDGPAPESEWEPYAVPPAARSARKKKRGRFRRAGLIPPALGIAAVLAAIVYLASYVTTANGSGAASMFGAIDGLGHSGSVAALEQERMTIIEMDAAAKTLTPDSAPVTVDPAVLQQQIFESQESGGTAIAAEPPADPTAAQQDAENMLVSYGWNNTTQWTCLYNLWEKESTWNVYAENPTSGAYGIPQSLPASKMAMFGSDYLTDPITQIKWGLWYINAYYGTPCNAWQSEVIYGAY
jgi:hypothetical protein